MEYYSGWEKYYSTNQMVSNWKDDTEPFLVDNANMFLPDNGSLNVLDVACGDGRNTGFFYYNNCRISCIDISKTALQMLDHKYPNTVKICCNVVEAPLLENQFDIVICFDGLAQMEDPELALNKLISFTRVGGMIIYNLFTPEDCAYGEGEKIDDISFNYKDTLFKFYTMQQAKSMIPLSANVLKAEHRHWSDPPHGDFRPYPHEHDASFFILQKNSAS